MTKFSPSPGPARAGGDDDDLGAVLAHVLRGKPHAGDDLDVPEVRELHGAPVEDAAPLPEAGELRHPARDPADLGLGLDEVDAPEAALAEHDRALHARGARADDEDVAVAVLRGLELLGMPAAAVLLARGRVLRAAEVVAPLGLHHADVAADALAHLAVAPLLDLLGQKWVGDGRARRPDQVPRARADDLRHAVGVGQAADADDRLRGRLPYVLGPLELVALLEEARRARVLRPVENRAHVDVPEVDEMVGEADELEALRELDARRPEGLDAEPHRDRAVVADGFAHCLERLEPEARAVLERAAVGVRALVVEGREELKRQVRVPAVDVDDVEAGVADEPRRPHPVAPDAVDVLLLHRLGDDERVVVARDLRRRDRRPARLAVGAVSAPVRQLDAGERAVPVRLVGHQREVAHVILVPDPLGDDRVVVGVGADESLLGADGGPAALRLHPAEARLRARLLAPEARAVGHLVEAVSQRLRADLDRLEEHVMAGIAGHAPG